MSESNTLAEADLALLNALQMRPRADFSSLAEAVGSSPATVARRWQRLRARGAAWITVTVGRRYGDGPITALGLIAGEPARQAELAEALLGQRAVATMSSTLGSWNFLVDIFLTDLDALRDYLPTLRSLPGVTALECHLFSTIFSEGGSWRLGALDKGQQRHLMSSGAVSEPSPITIDDLDRALIAALSIDGRASWAELGAACGVSAPTTRRRVERLLRSGVITVRCEVALQVASPLVAVTFLASAPTADVARIAAEISAMRSCRLIATLVAAHNIAFTMWLANVSQVEQFERSIAARFPSLVIADRILHVSALKRVGHVLDDAARSTRVVPLAAW